MEATAEVQAYNLKLGEQTGEVLRAFSGNKGEFDYFSSEKCYTIVPFYLGVQGQRAWITKENKLIIEGELEKKLNKAVMKLVKNDRSKSI